MNIRILDSPVSSGRHESPLCSDAFRRPLTGLPPVLPTKSMKAGLWATSVLTFACICLVLWSPMDEFVSAPGIVRPADYAIAFSAEEGILMDVDVTDGARVRKGDVLARLDETPKRAEIVRLEGELAVARAEAEVARAAMRRTAAAPVPPEFLFSGLEVERQSEVRGLQEDYLKRLQELQKTGAASGTEMLNVRLQLITSEAMLKRSLQANELLRGPYGAAVVEEAAAREQVATARVRALEARLQQERLELERLVIVAPENGVIIATARHFPGERIRAGEALFKITDAEATALRLYASEDRVDRIRVGQLVRFRGNNNPDRLAPLAIGRVTAVAVDRDLETEPEARNQGSYRVAVKIEHAPYPLAVGATVSAEIIIDRRPFWRLLSMRGGAAM